MAKGGYRIIDFKKAALTSGTEANIAGAFDAATNPYGKATLVSGLVVGDVEYPEFFAPFVGSSETVSAAVVIGGNTITIEIATDDDVTVTVA